MNRSVKYFLIIGLFLCAKQNFAENKATIRECSRFYAENAKNTPAYQDHAYEPEINAALFSPISLLQISRTQPTRSVHFARVLFVSVYKFSSELQAVANKFYSSNGGSSAKLKLILFPFHAFW